MLFHQVEKEVELNDQDQLNSIHLLMFSLQIHPTRLVFLRANFPIIPVYKSSNLSKKLKHTNLPWSIMSSCFSMMLLSWLSGLSSLSFGTDGPASIQLSQTLANDLWRSPSYDQSPALVRKNTACPASGQRSQMCFVTPSALSASCCDADILQYSRITITASPKAFVSLSPLAFLKVKMIRDCHRCQGDSLIIPTAWTSALFVVLKSKLPHRLPRLVPSLTILLLSFPLSPDQLPQLMLSLKVFQLFFLLLQANHKCAANKVLEHFVPWTPMPFVFSSSSHRVFSNKQVVHAKDQRAWISRLMTSILSTSSLELCCSSKCRVAPLRAKCDHEHDEKQFLSAWGYESIIRKHSSGKSSYTRTTPLGDRNKS